MTVRCLGVRHRERQVIADGSYTNRSNIVEMEKSHIDLIGPVPDGTAKKETLYQIRGVTEEFRPEAFTFDAAKNCYTCPVGKSLPYKTKNVLPGQTKYTTGSERRLSGLCAPLAVLWHEQERALAGAGGR